MFANDPCHMAPRRDNRSSGSEPARTANVIARMIRQNPTITAQMVADRLSYSEPKALRYQLNRIGYRNFSQFRTAVLEGAYVPPVGVAEEATAETAEPLHPLPLDLPLALRITAAGEPLFGTPLARRPIRPQSTPTPSGGPDGALGPSPSSGAENPTTPT